MDDIGGDDMDTGIHGNQLRFLRVLLRHEVSTQHLPGATQLPRHRQRLGQGLWLVLWPRPHVPSPPSRHLHRFLHGFTWLWPPMAPPQQPHHSPLFPG